MVVEAGWDGVMLDEAMSSVSSAGRIDSGADVVSVIVASSEGPAAASIAAGAGAGAELRMSVFGVDDISLAAPAWAPAWGDSDAVTSIDFV